MNHKGVYLNDMVYPKADFSKTFLEYLRVRVPKLRERAKDLIEARAISPSFGFQQGIRFYTDATVLERVLSDLTRAGGQTDDNELKLDSFIIAAYLDAAQADHWYQDQPQTWGYPG